MSDFSYQRIERFVIGTIGLPGEREFYLQILQEGSITSFALEKNQALALAERMRELLKEIRRRSSSSPSTYDRSAPDDLPLALPVYSEFRLGEMSLMWVEEGSQIVFEASSADDSEPGSVTASLTLAQAAEFIRRTELVVSAGRAPCPFCGLPLNIEGHLCPRANGYRR
jgi:uncharacterized repeat protein (TIGR03847 family)